MSIHTTGGTTSVRERTTRCSCSWLIRDHKPALGRVLVTVLAIRQVTEDILVTGLTALGFISKTQESCLVAEDVFRTVLLEVITIFTTCSFVSVISGFSTCSTAIDLSFEVITVPNAKGVVQEGLAIVGVCVSIQAAWCGLILQLVAGGAAEALGGEVVTVCGSSGAVHQCGTLGWVSVSIGTTWKSTFPEVTASGTALALISSTGVSNIGRLHILGTIVLPVVTIFTACKGSIMILCTGLTAFPPFNLIVTVSCANIVLYYQCTLTRICISIWAVGICPILVHFTSLAAVIFMVQAVGFDSSS